MSNYGRDDFFITVPNDMTVQPEQSWYEGFKASVAEINYPLLESLQEHRLFGDVEVMENFDVVGNIDEDLLPYYPDLIGAKTPEHLDFLQKRVRKALDRDVTAGNAPLSAQLAAGIFGDPLFLTTFLPVIGQVKLGTTVASSALKFGAVGAGFGALSEARRAPFAVAEAENESLYNIVATTAISGLTGGVVKFGADNLVPFARKSANKAMGFVKGDLGYAEQIGGDFDPVFGNPFASPAYRVMQDKNAPQAVKQILANLTYNSSVPLQGQRTKSLGQSATQRSSIYLGMARRHEEKMRDLHAQATKGNAKAPQIFGAYIAKPFSRDFDEFYQNLVKKYILTKHPVKGKRILDESTDVEKQAFAEIKNFFDDMDINARDVKLEGFVDDINIKERIQKLETSVEEKTNKIITLLRDREEKRVKLLASIETNARKNNGYTKKQLETIEKIEEERLQDLFRTIDLDKETDIGVKIVEKKGKTVRGRYVPAFYNKEKNTITIDKKFLLKDFKNKSWTKPKVKGVKPLPENQFTKPEDWYDFVLRHEILHTRVKQKPKETKASYENRINQLTLQTYKRTKQKFESDLDLEIKNAQNKVKDLQDILQSPTRKSYMFPIFYNKIIIKDKNKRAELTNIFEEHYKTKGDSNPRATAETTLERILSEDAEELGVMRGGKGNKAKHMMHRKTDIEEWQVADYMDLSIEAIYTYAERMGKRIEFKRKFGDDTIDDLLEKVEIEARKANLSDKKVAQYKVALLGEYDRYMGALVRNPDRYDNQLAQAAKTYSGWVYLPLAGVSAATDHGNIVMAHGMQKYLEAGLTTVTDLNYGKMSMANLRSIGEGLDIARNFTQRRLLGDTLKRYQPNRLERVQQVGNQLFYTANGLGPMTVTAKFLDHMLVNDKFIKASRQLRDGTIDRFDREYLYRYGIDDELAKYLADMPTEKSSTSSLEFANTDDWPTSTAKERDFIKQYQSATAAHANNAVVYGQAFDKPLITEGVAYIKDNPFFASMRAIYPKLFEIERRVSTPTVKYVRVESGMMSLPFTFMNFAFGANNKILGAIRDPNRKYRIQGVMTLMALAYFSLDIREKLKGKQGFLGSPYRSTLDETARIVEYSGVLGIYSDLGYMGLAMAASFGAENLPLNPKYLNPNEEQRLADGITEPFGAPVGLALTYYRAMNEYLGGNIKEGNEEIVYSIPFLGHPLLRNDVRDMMLGDRYRY